jgi:Dolichyl-phosphate-mannose-protein mannosyltransferase
VSVAISSRLLVWAAAVGALALFGVRGLSQAPSWSTPFSSQAANFVVAPALRWDSGWYLSIAHGGYFSASATAFFPLYPLLLKAGGVALGSDQVAGLVISLAATIVSLYLLYVLAELELGRQTARTSVLLLAFFPTALFLSAVYTEALFLALSLGVFLAARRERWMWAAVLAGFASATRSTGILLVLPLAWLYLYGPRSGGVAVPSPRRWMPRFRLERSAAWLALAPAGLIAYMTYLGIAHGAPLAPFQAEQYWAREFAGPFGAVFAALLTLPASLAHIWNGTQYPLGPQSPFGWQTYQLIDLPFLAFALAGLWLCWRKLPTAYLAYAALALAEALSYPVSEEPLKSFSRYLLVIFPLFIAWGAYLAERPLSRRVMLATCGLGLAGFSALWGIWAWVA